MFSMWQDLDVGTIRVACKLGEAAFLQPGVAKGSYLQADEY